MTDTRCGTDAQSLLNHLDEALVSGLIPASIFGNAELFQYELRKIFARAWVFLAHESEIAAKGDYVVRKIGQDNFIVSLGEDGAVNVLLDACRHRGVAVCRAESGNASHFRCPYHGWTYNSAGEMTGAPLWRSALSGLDKSANNLIRAAQVDSYQGLIFATLDASAPALEDYLGGMAWYLDTIFGLNEHGIELLGPPQRFVFDGNWKSAAENFAGDDYHVGTLHRTVYAVGAFPVPFAQNMMGYHIQAAPGHSLSLSMADNEDDPGPKFRGTPDDLAATFDTARISEDQLRIAKRTRVFVGNVFPNFSIVAAPLTEDSKRYGPTGVLSIRCWQPAGPNSIEVWNWFCSYKNATPEQKERAYKAGLGTFSMGGIFEMDDSEPWLTTTRTGSSVAAEVLGLDLNYQMGLDGIGESKRVTEFPGPGVVYSPRHEEGVHRNFYRFYTDLMKAPEGKWPESVAGQ
ncbi:MAG TPA: Rieske 2Fe-2S domain-containing protein [Mycobacterium sp.]|nr:Rieske 2Fe-2S domain-containing protein [Mycobacterium sp.]